MQQPDIAMPVKLEFIRRIIENLNVSHGIPLSKLIMRKFLLLNAIESKINNYRKIAFAKGYQQTFFDNKVQIETSFDFSFKFGKYYPVTKVYQGSIKFNNGCEFSQHEKIDNLLNTKSYFAHPYSCNDKGTVENINGLIRRFFPKGTNFDNISEEAIAYVEDWINNRRMKIPNYMTHNQKFQQCSVALDS